MKSPLVEFFRELGIVLTRDEYLDLCYPQGVPRPWTPELEMEMPKEFRKPVRIRKS
jgi:hypothetical protein